MLGITAHWYDVAGKWEYAAWYAAIILAVPFGTWLGNVIRRRTGRG